MVISNPNNAVTDPHQTNKPSPHHRCLALFAESHKMGAFVYIYICVSRLAFIPVLFLFCQGQMLYIAESDLMLFQCYPSVMNLDDLTK